MAEILMSAQKYQAGIGPGMSMLHICVPPSEPGVIARPSLCESTNIVIAYRGRISISGGKLCRRCFKILQETLGLNEAITAELIGVSEIEE